MTRLTAPPGTSITLPEGALFAFYRVEEGALEQTTTGPGGTFTSQWLPGGGGTMEALPDVEQSMTVTGDEPAVLLELAVAPSDGSTVATEDVATATGPTLPVAASVQGTVSCAPVEDGTTTTGEGVEGVRDYVLHCTYVVDDPRMNGTSVNRFNEDCFSGARCVYWGTEVLPGPDGTWLSSYRGADDPAGRMVILEVYEGTGAYEGWSVVGHITVGDQIEFDGVIYGGQLPPVDRPSPVDE